MAKKRSSKPVEAPSAEMDFPTDPQSPESPFSGSSQDSGSPFDQPGQGMGQEMGPAPVQSSLDYEPPKNPAKFPGASNPNLDLQASELVDHPPVTEDYAPWGSYGMWGYYWFLNRNRPPFSYWTVREMMTDPRVIFGLWLIKGPIVSKAKFDVECQRADVKEFIEKNLRRFMAVAAGRVLKALEWGYSASEVEYRYNPEDHLIHFDNIRDLESLDCRPVTNHGTICGFIVRNAKPLMGTASFTESMDIHTEASLGRIPSSKKSSNYENGQRYIGFPRGLFHIHGRDRNPWFGLSRLFGAHVPWWEQWSEDGYRAIRRLWYLKNSFDGGVLYHPPGQIGTATGPKATRDYAREMLEKRRAGGVLTLPNTPGPDGTGKAWEYIPPAGNPVPAGLLEYGDLLKDEVLEGLGIPPEIIQASGDSGFGSSSGRQVPQMAFYSVLLELVQWLVHDFDRQVLRYIVGLNFQEVQYEITAQPLDSEGVQSHPNDPNQKNNPLDPNNQPGQPEPVPGEEPVAA